MSMQIKEIILYNSQGEKRILKFKPGSVNIITGRSKAGKSAIIEIVEFCLGRSKFLVPEGVIRQNVAWYALKLQVNESEIFIAKPPPRGRGLSQSQAYFKVAGHIEIPDMSELILNTNDDGIVTYLGQLLGMSSNLHIPKKNETRDSLEASFKHARIFSFQKQSVIADENLLFHRQKEDFIPQSIKDTFPYFLGAVREDYLKLEHSLRMKKRELKQFQKVMLESELLSGNGIIKAVNLIEEAKQVGLISEEFRETEIRPVIEKLRQTESWKPYIETEIEADELAELQEQRKQLIYKISTINEKIKAAESYALEAIGYSSEVNQQRLRLESINLFSDEVEDMNHKCPLCSSALETEIPSVRKMNASLNEIKNNLEVVDRERPKLRKYIENNQDEINQIKQKIREIDLSLEALMQEQQDTAEIRDTNNRIFRVQGRISLFLENYKEIQEDSLLHEQIKTLESDILYLENIIDESNKEEMLTSILSRISKYMSEWAIKLELEHASSPYRLDIKNLTVVADQEDRPIPMYRMGSAENWLGCHLISHLALHKYFIEKQRPVPSFLILDQPTQVYFPSERYEEIQRDSKQLSDEDVKAVTRMFKLLFDVCEEMNPYLQIIVLDHANLDNDSFQNALVEEPWRVNLALIPDEWIN
ncbi:DUF3732 domain-containing protein [Bacillus zanthoxyli]|nr:DUF3732 domain-containing protein [Bacillus zanthoxyli]